MTICSCLVHTQPGQGALVAAQLLRLPGVEVHGGVAEDTLVVTLEDDGQHSARDGTVVDTLSTMGQVPGVVHTILIYHYDGNDIQTEARSHDHQPA
jgi:nitrate reductase NapAB chaperone NapD